MVHVLTGDVELLVGDELLHEARIEIDKVAGAAAIIGKMLHRKAQTTRAGGADHDPGLARREVLVVELVAELLVIHAEVVPADALLRHAGGAAGFENVERLAFECGGHPDLRLLVTQPLVLEMRELGDDVLIAVHHATRVEILLRPFQPEGAAGLRREMPLDGFTDLVVELGFGFFGCHEGRGLKAGTVKRAAINESKIACLSTSGGTIQMR